MNRAFLCLTVVAAWPALAANPFAGDWALTSEDGGAIWLGVAGSDTDPAVRMMWKFGGVRSAGNPRIEDGNLRFETVRASRDARIVEEYEVNVTGDEMTLKLVSPGKETATGKRQPPLPAPPDLPAVRWGEPVSLFNGRNLAGWRLTNPKATNGWSVEDGVMINSTPGRHATPRVHYGNIRTDQEFEDFKLTLEARVPEEGNSGVYLRGIYEVQVSARGEGEPGLHGAGSIFSRIAPSSNAARPAGEWQSYGITLVDRRVTVELNGVVVIDNRPLHGCTGGALWSDVERPGPVYLQGDHTDVEYRNIVLTPVAPLH